RRLEGLPPETQPNPPRDYVGKAAVAVSLDAGKLRYCCDRQQWDPVQKTFYPQNYLDVFNGQLFKSFRHPASNEQEYPEGAIRTLKTSASSTNFNLFPLISTFRGNHPEFYQQLAKFKITAQRVDIGGRPCLELARPSGSVGGRETLYLDRERGYTVVQAMVL